MAAHGAFQVAKQGNDATVTAHVCIAGVPVPYLTLVLEPNLAHEMARQLVEVVGPDPVVEQRVAIEVHDRVKAQSAELIHAAQIATLAMVRRTLGNYAVSRRTGPGIRAALRILDDVIEAEAVAAGDR